MYRAYNKFINLFGSVYYAKVFFGAIIRCDLHDLIQRIIFYFGIWEPELSYLTIELLRKGDVYIDVGANIGYDTLLSSKLVGCYGKVVSIEASPAIFVRLTENVHNNEANNVRLVNFAVSDRRQTLTLYSGNLGNVGSTSTIAARGQPIETYVEALPLDEILTSDEISRTRLIKIDIEGAEPMVLNRFLDKLDLYPRNTIIIVEASIQDAPGDWRIIFTRFQNAGFTVYEFENLYTTEWYLKWRRPSKLKPITTMPTTQTDLLFTREPIETTTKFRQDW
jgi:FkbM family methyltransferase